MFKVYIMCGLPGAGKSTYIKEHLSNVKVISSDDIRCELHICGATFKNQRKCVGSPMQEKEVYDILYSRLEECCKNEIDCVIDNTNLSYKSRQEIINRVSKYNPEIIIVYVDTPVETCIERRKKYIYKSIYYTDLLPELEIPTEKECNKLIQYKAR